MIFNIFKKSNKKDIHQDNTAAPKTIKKNVLDKLDKQTFKNLNNFSMFEKVNDARSLFLLERIIHKNIIYIAFFFFITTIISLILIISLLPLKEKEPYLVGFSNAAQNFVTIEKASSAITSNESLVRSLIGAYILNRESINHIDDKKRFEVIKAQSSPKVWSNFEALIAQEQSIYTNPNLIREIEIINIAKWKDGYSNVDVVIRLFNANGMVLESEKRYRIIVVYKFINQKITFDNIPINPTGFQVIDYAITQIAIIKELDSNKQINSSNSKIQSNTRNNDIDGVNPFLLK